MVKIIVKPAKDNARNRRRDERQRQRDQRSSEASLERRIANELTGSRAATLAEKASGGIENITKDPILESGGGDAMHSVVNHAHQRDPRKKWS